MARAIYLCIVLFAGLRAAIGFQGELRKYRTVESTTCTGSKAYILDYFVQRSTGHSLLGIKPGVIRNFTLNSKG